MFLELPALSAHDPATSGEGSRDPLGLEGAAERLASTYLPAVTSRMTRIRALTVLAFGAHVCEAMRHEYTADESAPAWLVFEWTWAEAMARRTHINTTGIPGIDTTRRRIHNGERLCHRNYLKGATALGLHGFYRTLAEDTAVLTKDGELDENGERLLHAWSQDQQLDGLIAGTGEGQRLVEHLRWALERSLKASACRAAPTGWGVQQLQNLLRPSFNDASRREKLELDQLLRQDDRRAAVLTGLSHDAVGALKEDRYAQMLRLADVTDHEEVAAAVRAMVAFERFAAAVSFGFDLVRHRSTQELRTPHELKALQHEDHDGVVREIPTLISDADDAFSDLPQPDDQRDAALAAFREVRTVEDLLDALMQRHGLTQRGKGSRGKLPWLETTGAGVTVRSPYVLADAPAWTTSPVHPTRFPNASSFLRELA